jgi:poly-D-alanine transfer protein DltD
VFSLKQSVKLLINKGINNVIIDYVGLDRKGENSIPKKSIVQVYEFGNIKIKR